MKFFALEVTSIFRVQTACHPFRALLENISGKQPPAAVISSVMQEG